MLKGLGIGVAAASVLFLGIYVGKGTSAPVVKEQPSAPAVVKTRPTSAAEYARVTVMITNEKQTSGGSGSIMRSGANGSYVLTNKHVCELIQVGGRVITDTQRVRITHYKVYPKHDLCLIKVDEDLGITTALADKDPAIYSEANVTGHPQLLPTIVTKGHFSGKEEIDVMVGVEPCDGSEGPEDMMSCIFTGQKALVKRFESQAVSALIMPGSSGSGIFTDKGELAAVVFAGSQGLSYGFIVPYKFVKDFLKNNAIYKWREVDPKAKAKTFFKFERKNTKNFSIWIN